MGGMKWQKWGSDKKGNREGKEENRGETGGPDWLPSFSLWLLTELNSKVSSISASSLHFIFLQTLLSFNNNNPVNHQCALTHLRESMWKAKLDRPLGGVGVNKEPFPSSRLWFLISSGCSPEIKVLGGGLSSSLLIKMPQTHNFLHVWEHFLQHCLFALCLLLKYTQLNWGFCGKSKFLLVGWRGHF